MSKQRDHGGGIDAAAAKWGGQRQDWVDLSTGINPVPYDIADFPADSWTALPDRAAFDALELAARRFWSIPDDASVLAAPGASSIIAQLPAILKGTSVAITKPTYNEHEAAFLANGWQPTTGSADVGVVVHPNNPDGRIWAEHELKTQTQIIDESFCDVTPDLSHMLLAKKPGTVILKSFGKFWGLAGLRLGFAIGDPDIIAKLATQLGPWQVSGPALDIGARALADTDWASNARSRLATDAIRLDALMTHAGAQALGGTDLFRLYRTNNAQDWQDRLAQNQIWSRIFPYSDHWLRLGLPAPSDWDRLEAAL